MLEAIALCEEITETKLDWKYFDENRQGDHMWWISDISRFQSHYPRWNLTYDVPAILQGGVTSCAQEQNLVLVAGSSSSNALASLLRSQIYGVVVTEALTLSQNYDFWQVPDVWTYLPSPITTLLGTGTTMPVVVQQWHELMN